VPKALLQLIFAGLGIADHIAIRGTHLPLPIEHTVIRHHGTGSPILGKLVTLGSARRFVLGIMRSTLGHTSSCAIIQERIPFAPDFFALV